MQLVIELPSREEQLAFNRRRWEEICDDPNFANWPGRVEMNAHGIVLMMPPPAGIHSIRQSRILTDLFQLLNGQVLAECPISTIGGVRAADVGWYTNERFSQVENQIAFEIAPEICVEVISPKNTVSEMREKKQLYFEAGAEEVWFCGEDGKMSFYLREQPSLEVSKSRLCPEFPGSVH